jgi:hypothetical protein
MIYGEFIQIYPKNDTVFHVQVKPTIPTVFFRTFSDGLGDVLGRSQTFWDVPGRSRMFVNVREHPRTSENVQKTLVVKNRFYMWDKIFIFGPFIFNRAWIAFSHPNTPKGKRINKNPA